MQFAKQHSEGSNHNCHPVISPGRMCIVENFTKVTRILSVDECLDEIRNGTFEHHVSDVRKKTGKEYEDAKKQLPGFVFGGTFQKNYRAIANLATFSGFITLDIDFKKELQSERDDLRNAIIADPHTYAAFWSPAFGIKIISRIDGMTPNLSLSDENTLASGKIIPSPMKADLGEQNHKVFNLIADYYLENFGIDTNKKSGKKFLDPSGKDIPRLCFACHDPELFRNSEAIPFSVPTPEITPEPENNDPLGILNIPGFEQETYEIFRAAKAKDESFYSERAIKNAVGMIERSQDGQKYHDLLKAANLLGGYVAGNIMSESDASSALENAIKSKPNVSCMKTALKAISDGIKNGLSKPITLENCEQQRQAFIASLPPREIAVQEPEVTPDEIYSELAQMNEKTLLKPENFSKLVQLEINDKSLFIEILDKCKGKKTYIMKSVQDEKRKLHKADVEKANSEKPKPSDIIAALKDAGWHFAANDMDDSVECNGRRMTDFDTADIFCHCHETGLFTGGERYIHHLCIKAAGENRYHPVKEYLNSLSWNGNDNIRMLSEKITVSNEPLANKNCEPVPLQEIYLKKWLVGCCAKVFESSQNPALVFSGPQEIGKSEIPKWLCSSIPEYFCEESLYGHKKDLEMLQIKKFIWEIPEFDASNTRIDVSSVKAMITRKMIDVRPHYGHFSIQKPVSASYLATVNTDDFLNDVTGNRRFLCLSVTGIDWSYSEADPDQIWAQAVSLYQNDFDWSLTNQEKEHRNKENMEYISDIPLTGWIAKHFTITGNKDDYISTADIIDHLRLNNVPISGSKKDSMDIGNAMSQFNGVKKARQNSIRGFKGLQKQKK